MSSLKEQAKAAVYTERKAIEEEIKYIREERRMLADRYFDLLDRLRKLDERDMEAFDPNVVVENLSDVAIKLSNLMPQVTVEQILDSIKSEIDVETIVENSVKESSKIASKDILMEQQREENYKTIKKEKRNDLQKQAPLVRALLNELGRPAKTSEIAEMMFDRHSITWNNPSNALTRVMEYDPKIERLGKGMYQLRF